MFLQRDSLGRTIPSGEIKVWLDDDIVDRAAPPGWVHVQTSEQACALLVLADVVELSLDHDLGDDVVCGRGMDVVDFLDRESFLAGRSLWPRDGVTLHTANPYGRDAMARAIVRSAGRTCSVRQELTASGKQRLLFLGAK